MTHVKAQVQLQIDSALPEDRPVNTFHFNVVTVNDTTLDLIAAVLKGAYDSFATTFSGVVAQNGHGLKMYRMTDTPPRVPVYDDTFNLDTNPSGDGLPPEIAICVSFQGDRVSGEPQARRRGRIYLGPCKEDDNAATGTPGAGLVTAAAAFGQYILDASVLDTGWTWCVYSTVDNELVDITNGWVDNAWDVQRRRGLTPTSRTTFFA